MKGYAAFIVLLLAVFGILMLIFVTSKEQTPRPKPQPSTQIEGSITTIATDDSSLMLKPASGPNLTVLLREGTSLKDNQGETLSVSELYPGFHIKISGKREHGTSITANEIIVTKMPAIILYNPSSGSTVTNVFTVSGIARVFENVVSLRITNLRSNKVLLTGFLEAASPDIGLYGPFSNDITLTAEDLRRGDKIEITVFQASAKDGSEQDVVHSVVTYDTVKRISLNVYFTNDILNPEAVCERVFPVTRTVPVTQAVAKAALEELLRGTTDTEEIEGYGTALNANVSLRSIIIKDDVAYADFSEALQRNVGGSCRVTAIQEQIKQTLLQFSTIKDVIISVEGETEAILQP